MNSELVEKQLVIKKIIITITTKDFREKKLISRKTTTNPGRKGENVKTFLEAL